jgi:carbon monoxide dehydrogenase subunit G
MAVLTSSIEIPRSPQEVWEVVADLDKYEQWMTLHAGFPDGPPGKAEPGTVFREKVKVMGMPGDVKWTVSELEEARRIGMEGEGPMGTTLRAVFELEPAGDGTRVSYESEFGGAALAALQGPVEKEAKKAGDESLEKLRALVAGEPATAAS